MRFLYSMLAVVWIAFGYVCFEALQWQPPYDTPPDLIEVLQKTDEQEIDQRVDELRALLSDGQYSTSERAYMHFLLALQYWHKTFLQQTRQKQTIYLQFAEDAVNQALELYPDHHRFLLLLGDIHRVQGQYTKAEETYSEALESAIEHDAPEKEKIENRLMSIPRQQEGARPLQ